jgi:hypothetical protein
MGQQMVEGGVACVAPGRDGSAWIFRTFGPRGFPEVHVI